MKTPQFRLLVVALGLSGWQTRAQAQDKPADASAPSAAIDNKAASRAAFAQARAQGGINQAAVDLLRKAVELDPSNTEAHQYYILFYENAAAKKLPKDATDEQKKAAREAASEEILKVYTDWISQHPDVAGYRCALGQFFLETNAKKSRAYLDEAVRIDPKCGGAYDMLAIWEEAAGNLPQSREFAHKAVEVQPDNVGFWRHYVGSVGADDWKRGLAAAVEMGKQFPEEAGSIATYVANRPFDEASSREAFEFVLKEFPKTSPASLAPLFSIYLRTDPAKALDFARSLAAKDPNSKPIATLVAYGQAIVDAEALIASGKPADAVTLLNKVELPRYGPDPRVRDILRAKALAASGKANDAYAGLLATFAAHPNDDAREELAALGKQIGKDRAAVDAEVASSRSATAKPGIPFSLVDYATGKIVSLDDYKGRVVLVNFWFPFCGPCRGEFPYLQAVLDKYKSRGFAILGINGLRDQDDMVLPLVNGWKLGFVPLGGTEDVVKAYKVRGFPSNFLYGPDGRIYYSPGPVSGASPMRELELQVEALLALANPDSKA